MTERREFLQLAGALAGASLLPGLAGTAFAQANGKKHLVVSLAPEPSGIYLLADNPSLVVTLNVNDGLVSYDKDFKPVPQLAESWAQSEDGRTIATKRPGVKWHDGKPFTAADVKFSVELTKKSSPVAAAAYAHLTAVQTPDDLTVILKFDHPSQALWAVLDGAKTQIMPRHLHEGTDQNANPYNNKPIGTGASIFQEWVPDAKTRSPARPLGYAAPVRSYREPSPGHFVQAWGREWDVPATDPSPQSAIQDQRFQSEHVNVGALS